MSISGLSGTILFAVCSKASKFAGVDPTDAVNMSQFSGLANDVSALRSDISNVASSAYRSIAGVAALTSGNSCDSRENVD